LRPTPIEFSLERRDSMRTSRSRLASWAALGTAAGRLHFLATLLAFAFERRAA
jgi:hypothetical protein